MIQRTILAVATTLMGLCVIGQPTLLASPPDPFATATLNVRAYFDADGLPQNSVESVSVDPEGRLWVTTRDGGAVFDGTTWTQVQMPDPAVSNWPRHVLATSDGSVWFGIEPEGLSRFRNDSWQSWHEKQGLPGHVNAMVEGEGELVIATSEGVFSIRFDSPSPVLELGEADVRTLARRGGLTLAVTSRGDILKRGRAGWQPAGYEPVDGASPISMLMTQDSLVVGTSNGILVYKGTAPPRPELAGVAVTALTETTLADESTLLWAGTDGNGLFRLDGDAWMPVAPAIEIPNRYVYDLVATPAAGPSVHLFVGTLSGIGRIDLVGWRHIGTEEGLPDSSVVSVMESRTVSPGTYYIGTTSGLAVEDESGRWASTSCDALRDVSVFSMLESVSMDSLYFGTSDGVVAVDSRGCRRVDGLDNTSVVSLAVTGSESTRLWAGTYGDGLWSLSDSGEWTALSHDIPDSRIEALLATGPKRDTLWIATNQGLVRMSGDEVRVFDRSSGLPHDLVRSLQLHEGYLWVGTAGGLSRASIDEAEPHWKSVELRGDGRLTNDTVYRIEVDRLGRVYVLTGRGVARLERDTANGSYDLGRVFLSDDGLPSSETNFGASMVDFSGRVWAGTPRGAGVFDPALESRGDSSSHHLILSLVTEPDGTPISDGDVLPIYDERIVASYRLIDLAHGPRAVYRTQLSGLDTGPGSWSSSSQRVFTKLRGGRYELRVWARDPHGHEAGPSTISFSVQPPAWLSWWAVLVYVAVGVFLLYTAVGLRIRSLRRRNQDLELIVRSRTRDLEVANRQLESANVTLADMSVTDPLTGAKNRRYLLQAMEIEAVRVRRSTRESDDIVFVLVDIDRFKHLNDRFGHATGDLVLKQFYRVLAKAVRDSDTIVRWGGEEFLIVARKMSRSEAQVLADRILNAVREERFESLDSARRLRLTCSVGFATFPFVTWDRSLFTWEQVIDIADHCLYAVKRSGRDGWVGLAAGEQLRSDSFLSRMRDDVATMNVQGEIEIMTSMNDPADLLWR